MSDRRRPPLREMDGERYTVARRVGDGRYAVRWGGVTIATFSHRKRAEAFLRALATGAEGKFRMTQGRGSV